jgi:two-component system, chemotaxis family, CheB/CheR fusion protein
MDTIRPSGPPVLIVDDCHDAADSLALLLKRWGYQTEVAYDGPSALAAALAQPPAVALLDIVMPVMDGYEVARRLRGRPQAAKVLLIALTGYGREEEVRRCSEAGFDLHLLKPCDPEELRRVLDGTIGRRSADRSGRKNVADGFSQG